MYVSVQSRGNISCDPHGGQEVKLQLDRNSKRERGLGCGFRFSEFGEKV